MKHSHVRQFCASSSAIAFVILFASCQPSVGPALPPLWKVTYDLNSATGGSVPVDSDVHAEGALLTVRGNTGLLTRTNCSFLSWNIQADGTGTSYGEGDTFTMGTANVTLYAAWLDNSTSSLPYHAKVATQPSSCPPATPPTRRRPPRRGASSTPSP